MIWCLALVTFVIAADGGLFGDISMLDEDLVAKLLNLVTVGLGGYVVSRGGEKIVKQFRESRPQTLDVLGRRGQRRIRKGRGKMAVKLKNAGFSDEQISDILDVYGD